MAANKLNKQQQIVSDGNAAYRLNTRPVVIPVPEQEQEKRQTKRSAPPTTRPKVELRPQGKISVTAVAGFVLAAILAVSVLTSHIQLAGIYADTVAAQTELSELEERSDKLQAEYEAIFDAETLQEAADAAGLQEATSNQKVYLELTEPDNAVVYQSSEQQTGLKGCVQAIKSFFVGLGTYFS